MSGVRAKATNFSADTNGYAGTKLSILHSSVRMTLVVVFFCLFFSF